MFAFVFFVTPPFQGGNLKKRIFYFQNVGSGIDLLGNNNQGAVRGTDSKGGKTEILVNICGDGTEGSRRQEPNIPPPRRHGENKIRSTLRFSSQLEALSWS